MSVEARGTPAASAGTPAASPEKAWWVRALIVFQRPGAVFAALRDDSDREADARQEPVIALVFLAAIAAVLATNQAARLLDPAGMDALSVAVWAVVAGAIYGVSSYWIGGGALYLGARGAGGRGSYRRARHTLAFAGAPLALSLFVVWPLRLAAYGGDAFRTGGADGAAGGWILEGVEAAFMVWALALLVVGVRVVHGWTVVRSVGALVLATLALLALAVVPFLLASPAR